MRSSRLRILLAMWLGFAGLTMGMKWVMASGCLTVSGPWVRYLGPGMKVHAGYFNLANSGERARAIVAAESPSYAAAELHRSRIVDGVATMESASRVEVPAGKTIAFAPGGLHLMLREPQQVLSEGSRVPIVLIFADGGRLSFDAVLRKDSQRGSHHSHSPKPAM